MKDKAKCIVRGFGVLLLVCIICFLGLKGCIVTVWTYPDTPRKYEVIGEDGHALSMTFLPTERTIMQYSDPANVESEIVLARMRGTFGTHYIGPLWRLEGPGVLIGLRWLPKGIQPLIMEIETLEKFRIGPGESIFPKVAGTTYSEMAFGDGTMRFQNMWLQEVHVDTATIEELLRVLQQRESDEAKN